MDLTKWLELFKQYGPVLGLLLGWIVVQSMWINKLLDRHEKAYTGEIERMHGQMNKLLEHVLGKQPSSVDSPSVKQLDADSRVPASTQRLQSQEESKETTQ